jgi:hypothetical protein
MNRLRFSKIAAIGTLWITVAAVCVTLPATVLAREVKNTTRTNVNKNVNKNANVNTNRNTNVNTNRNVNVNTNRNVNVNTNRHVDVDVDVDRHHHPIGTAVAVGATIAVTSAVVGSMVRTLPPSCSAVIVNGLTYQQCSGVWYQPQYSGSSVQYVVINQP